MSVVVKVATPPTRVTNTMTRDGKTTCGALSTNIVEFYIVEFKSGSIKFRELLQKRVVYHTVVQWEHYRRKEGVVQCSRCQRPGHGAGNCNMSPRCCLCGDGHETMKFPSTKKKLQTAMATENGDDTATPIEVQIPAKCCNSNAVGHFASDPKCPRKVAYIQSRRLRATTGRPDKKRNVPNNPTPAYSPGGPSFCRHIETRFVNFQPFRHGLPLWRSWPFWHIQSPKGKYSY